MSDGFARDRFHARLSETAIEGLEESIAHRRSLGVARLHPDPVEPEVIQRCLEAANWGPSHGDTEPWRFTVFTGEGRKVLADLFAGTYRRYAAELGTFREETYQAQIDRVMSAPVWISIGMEPGRSEQGEMLMREEEEVMAVACAAQNLHLMAAAQGLAGMWHSKGISVSPDVADFLGLKPPSRLLGFFFFGWPKVDWPAGERRPLSEKMNWIKNPEQPS